MKAGAHDYVMKGNLQRLTTAIERELRDVEVRRAHKRAEEWLKYSAHHDQLTDLPNRNLIYERLEQILSDNKPFALMLMDLDRFKEINDTIGHQAGDSLLQQAGLRLQGVARKADTVARLGGDEFGVLIPEVDGEAAALTAMRFLKAFEPPFLEITESVIMVDPARALETLTRISSMGVALSIDDFGTGYSSLSYLKKLPVNAVKIDKSFVINMTNDQNDGQIVGSTIDLVHNLGLKVIAEGIETREVWEQLLALGCDEAQGYYMSRPLPASEMTKWLFDSLWHLAKANGNVNFNGELMLEN